MGSGAPDHQLKIRIVDAFGYVDKIPVYEVAPVQGRYYASPADLTEADFNTALLDIKGRLITKAILDSSSATINVDVTDEWTRQLGLVDLSRVLGAALAHTNPVITRISDGVSAFIDPRQATVQNWPTDYPDAAVLTKLGAGLPAALDSLSLKVKEQNPITGYATSALQTTLNGYVDGIETLLGAGLPVALDTLSLKVREQNPITNFPDSAGDASLAIMDDWDETDRAKVNIVAGQAGITAGAGAVAASTPRVTLASDDPAVAKLDVALSTKARLQPWYQTNFLRVETGYEGYSIGPHASTVRASYTVPASRLALQASINLLMMRKTAATTAGKAKVGIYESAAASYTANIFEITNTVGAPKYSHRGWGQVFPAGKILRVETGDASTNGTYDYDLDMEHMVFDT